MVLGSNRSCLDLLVQWGRGGCVLLAAGATAAAGAAILAGGTGATAAAGATHITAAAKPIASTARANAMATHAPAALTCTTPAGTTTTATVSTASALGSASRFTFWSLRAQDGIERGNPALRDLVRGGALVISTSAASAASARGLRRQIGGWDVAPRRTR